MVLKKVSLLANGHAIIDQKIIKQTYFLKNNSLVNNTFLRVFLIFHIIIAVSSFIGWINLEIKSWKSFSKALPGEFSSKHIRQGKIIFGGVVATAITGVSLYILGFAI